MVPSLRNSTVAILLMLVALMVAIVVRSGGGDPDLEHPAAGQQSAAPAAEGQPAAPPEPDVAEEGPDVAKKDPAVVPEKPKVAQHGPILIPLNPPYLNSPAENDATVPAIEPTTEESARDQQQTERTGPDRPEDRQPAETKLATEREPPQDGQAEEEAQPIAELAALSEQLTDTEPAQQARRTDELAALSEQLTDTEAAQQARPEAEGPALPEGPTLAEGSAVAEGLAVAEDPAEEETPTEERPAEEAAEDDSQQGPAEATLPVTSTPPKPEPKRELTSAEVALRDRIRVTLAFHYRQALSASQNTATEVMHGCLAFGCNTEVYRSGSSGKKVNGITCLCWNYPCAGYEPLVLSEGRVAARVGYGLQEHPSQLLAVLALSRVKATYPVRVGEDVRTVADLVEHEKLSCRSGRDLSLKLIGLAYYQGDDSTWENGLGEEWSIERLIQEELDQPILGSACGGTYRLTALSYALARREGRGQPIEGQFARARKLVDEYHDYALELQNSDGSWGPRFLAARGASRDPALQLRSTGHVLEWLAMSLPEDRLDDPRLVRSLQYVNRLLGGRRYGRNVRSLSTQEIGSVMHALHALAVYDERFFKPRTAEAS